MLRDGQLLWLREAAMTSRANLLRSDRAGRPCNPAWRRAAGPMRDPNTLLQGPDYGRLCLLGHFPLRADCAPFIAHVPNCTCALCNRELVP